MPKGEALWPGGAALRTSLPSSTARRGCDAERDQGLGGERVEATNEARDCQNAAVAISATPGTSRGGASSERACAQRRALPFSMAWMAAREMTPHALGQMGGEAAGGCNNMMWWGANATGEMAATRGEGGGWLVLVPMQGLREKLLGYTTRVWLLALLVEVQRKGQRQWQNPLHQPL